MLAGIICAAYKDVQSIGTPAHCTDSTTGNPSVFVPAAPAGPIPVFVVAGVVSAKAIKVNPVRAPADSFNGTAEHSTE